jgi:hypothetical protein
VTLTFGSTYGYIIPSHKDKYISELLYKNVKHFIFKKTEILTHVTGTPAYAYGTAQEIRAN